MSIPRRRGRRPSARRSRGGECRKGRPVRTCVGCGERAEQISLARIQLAAGACPRPVARHSAGRSAYVHRRVECIDRLSKGRLLERSLGRPCDHADRESLVVELRSALTQGALGSGSL